MKRTVLNRCRLICFCLLLALCCALAFSACSTKVKVTFDPNYRGGATQSKEFVEGEKLSFPTVDREGFVLDGWFGDKACTKKVTTQDYPTNGATYYAKWTALPKNLTAVYNGTLFVGDELTKQNISVFAEYFDGNRVKLDASAFEVDLTNATAESGKHQFAVSYTENGKTVECVLELNITAIVAQELEVTYVGAQLFKGDSLNNADIRATVTYNNGSEKSVSALTVTGYSADTVGEQTITVAYTENGETVSATLTVTVQPIKLTEISVEYSGGEVFFGQQLDTTKLAVTARYNNGESKSVAIANCTVTGFNGNAAGTQTVIVSYTEDEVTKTATFAVTVQKKILTEISVVYSGGEVLFGHQLDTTKLAVTARYNNGESQSVAIANCSITGFNCNAAGTQTVTVSYTEDEITKSATFAVTVQKKILTEISVVYSGGEVPYGHQLDTTKLAVTVRYNNGESKSVAIANCTVAGFNCNDVGRQLVTVGYTEDGVTQRATFAVTVLEAELTSLTVETTEDLVIYLNGELDRTKLTVKAHYADGNSKVVSNYTLNLQSDTVGEKTAVVSYTDRGVTKTANLTVTVTEVPVVGISVSVKADATFFVGDSWNSSVLTVEASYADGKTGTIHSSAVTVTGFSSQTEGEKTLTVEYEGCTDTVTVTVQPVKLTEIKVSYSGGEVPYGQQLDTTKLAVTACYNNGDNQSVAIANCSIKGFNANVSGAQTVTVSYTDDGVTKSASFAVTVQKAPLTSIDVTYQEETVAYAQQLNTEKLIVKAHYADGASKTIAASKCVISGFNGKVSGAQTVTVSYTEDGVKKTAEFSVTVREPLPVSVVATYNGTVLVGEQPQNDKFTVKVTFEDGATKEVTNFSKEVLASASAGAKSLEISYTSGNKTVSCEVTITVVDFSSNVGGNLSIHFLELGNRFTGDSVYIKAGETDILIDAGSKKNSAPTICNYVDQFCTDGILEYVIATHAHEDHIAGFVGSSDANNDKTHSVFAHYKCGTIIKYARKNTTSIISSDFENLCQTEVAEGANLFTALECYNNQNGAQRVYDLTGDGSITLEILYQKYYDNRASSENDYSVCVMINQGENHYLFTGDLESGGESSLVDNNNLPHCVLYKGGHHGSKTSTTEKLMRAITPEYCCICTCCGSSEYTATPENQFPTQEFIDRISPYTDRVYLTTLCDNYSSGNFQSMNGDIVFSCVKGVVSVNCSNNNTKLKDTAWFKANRTCPTYWDPTSGVTSLYHD